MEAQAISGTKEGRHSGDEDNVQKSELNSDDEMSLLNAERAITRKPRQVWLANV